MTSRAEKAEAASKAWRERELAKAGPLTQQQQAELRRILLPAHVAKPKARRSA